MLLTKLNLPRDTTHACLNTLYNEKSYKPETCGKKIGDSGYYKNGVELKMRGDGNFTLLIFTVHNGIHTIGARIILDKNSKLISGDVNCFSLGWTETDMEYSDICLRELTSRMKYTKWDLIE